VLGVVLSFIGVRLFLATAPEDLPRLGDTHVSGIVLLAAAAISIVTAMLFGILPALRSMRANPQSAMQTNTARVSSGRDSRRTRHLLVAGEVACTLALLIVTGLLVRSFSNVLHQERDFDASHITLASAYLYAPQYADALPHSDTARAAFTERALADLSAIPGVQAVASTSAKPLTGDNWIDEIRRPDHPLPPSQMPNANIRWVSPSYAATLDIPILEGRDLNPSDKNHPTNALISQQTARSVWAGEDPIGRSFQLGENTSFTVVGIIADARINDLKSTANMVYIPYWQNPWWRVHFLIRSSQPTSSLVSEVRHVIWSVDPQVAIPSLTSLNEQISNSMATERFQTLLLSSFGAAGLLLALLGIYGVLTYSVSMRQQEFGIRIALGCEKPRLMAMVAGQAALPVMGGIVAGLVLAFFGARWVHSMLYETSAVDPWAIASSIGLLLAAALAAALLPARRAAMTNPMKVLRNE
jgi:predicted permease